MIISTPNKNSLSSKFDDLNILIPGMFDILITTETKPDNKYPISRFHRDDSSMAYRLGRKRNNKGVFIYVKEKIPSKFLRKHLFSNDIEEIFVEINFRKTKWILFCTYIPPSESDQYYFDSIDKVVYVYCQYEKVVLAEDFHAAIEERCFDYFLFQHEPR